MLRCSPGGPATASAFRQPGRCPRGHSATSHSEISLLRWAITRYELDWEGASEDGPRAGRAVRLGGVMDAPSDQPPPTGAAPARLTPRKAVRSRRRRPTGAPPPLPHNVRTSGVGWLVAA